MLALYFRNLTLFTYLILTGGPNKLEKDTEMQKLVNEEHDGAVQLPVRSVVSRISRHLFNKTSAVNYRKKDYSKCAFFYIYKF